MRAFHTIGVIAPMGEEEAQILIHLSHVQTDQEKAGLTFKTGCYTGQDGDLKKIIVVCAGIGKVNAALCAQLLIDLYHPDAIFNVGVAGGLAEGLHIGDIVISSFSQEHDMDCSGIGNAKGIIPRMETSLFEADPFLVKKATDVLDEMKLSYRVGKVLSGDQFISTTEKKQELIQLFDGTCAEMEGAAIAHVCYLNDVPHLIIRAISDQADDEAEVSYDDFMELAASRAGLICAGILSAI